MPRHRKKRPPISDVDRAARLALLRLRQMRSLVIKLVQKGEMPRNHELARRYLPN